MAKVFLESTDSNYKVVNDGVKVFGASESQAVEIEASVKNIIVDANVEQVNLSGNLTEYKLSQEGTNLVVKKGSDIIATIGTNELASKLKFADTDPLNISRDGTTTNMMITLPTTIADLSIIKTLDEANDIKIKVTATSLSGTWNDLSYLIDSDGNEIANNANITLSDSSAFDAVATKKIAELFSGDEAFGGTLSIASVTGLTGTTADIKIIVDKKASSKITLKSDVAITLSDTTATAADLKAIEAATTGLVDASSVTSITGAVADVKALVDKKGTTGDAVNLKDDVAITLSDTTAAAADIKAIDAATTGLVDASSVTSITGAVADVKAVTDNKGDSGDKVKLVLSKKVWVNIV